jgi:Xaa-Pro aminopeptidase
MVFLTRQAGFSAGHRYFLPDLSEEENRRLFGACANRNGHGHDYRCEVTVGGETDAETGMVLNLEPAAYVDSFGGLRHCDLVEVTPTGSEVLTPWQSALQDLVR